MINIDEAEIEAYEKLEAELNDIQVDANNITNRDLSIENANNGHLTKDAAAKIQKVIARYERIIKLAIIFDFWSDKAGD